MPLRFRKGAMPLRFRKGAMPLRLSQVNLVERLAPRLQSFSQGENSLAHRSDCRDVSQLWNCLLICLMRSVCASIRTSPAPRGRLVCGLQRLSDSVTTSQNGQFRPRQDAQVPEWTIRPGKSAGAHVAPHHSSVSDLPNEDHVDAIVSMSSCAMSSSRVGGLNITHLSMLEHHTPVHPFKYFGFQFCSPRFCKPLTFGGF